MLRNSCTLWTTLRGVLLTLVVLTVSTYAPASAQRPDAPVYALPGQYAVGVIDSVLEDNPSRTLPVSVWYPAQPSAQADATVTPEPPTYSTGLFFSFAAGVATRDAAPDRSGAPYPLVIFSHGSGSHRAFSLFLVEHLASQGFVVIAPDHTTNTAVDEVLAREVFDDSLASNYFQRPVDLNRAIDYAERLTADGGAEGTSAALAGLIDTDNIALIGHSFGGYTALATATILQNPADALATWCDDQTGLLFNPFARTSSTIFVPISPYREPDGARYNVCFLEGPLRALTADNTPGAAMPRPPDDRIRAVVALAPWNAPIFGEDSLGSIQVPALVIVGSRDTVTPPERDAYVIYNRLGSMNKALVVFENADHDLFVDECRDFMLAAGAFESCSDPVWDMARAHDLINHFVTSFLREVQLGDTGAARVFSPRQVDFPGIQVLRQAEE